MELFLLTLLERWMWRGGGGRADACHKAGQPPSLHDVVPIPGGEYSSTLHSLPRISRHFVTPNPTTHPTNEFCFRRMITVVLRKVEILVRFPCKTLYLYNDSHVRNRGQILISMIAAMFSSILAVLSIAAMLGARKSSLSTVHSQPRYHVTRNFFKEGGG